MGDDGESGLADEEGLDDADDDRRSRPLPLLPLLLLLPLSSPVKTLRRIIGSRRS